MQISTDSQLRSEFALHGAQPQTSDVKKIVLGNWQNQLQIYIYLSNSMLMPATPGGAPRGPLGAPPSDDDIEPSAAWHMFQSQNLGPC